MNENNIIHINIEKDFRNLVNQARLKFIANMVLNLFDKNDFEFTISIVGENKIRELNNNFRSINSVTDVLSFSANEMNPENGKNIIGDVIISYPIAEKQSLSLHQQIKDEFDLLTIHGVLHLLGYDHESKKKEKQMFAIQSKLVQQIKEPIKKNRNKDEFNV